MQITIYRRTRSVCSVTRNQTLELHELFLAAIRLPPLEGTRLFLAATALFGLPWMRENLDFHG